ncbi:WYL domain-containing protein [Streptomyces sp. BB1-1-1]|uniref:helix-turn-helix transcriptional regulator n=1 Tax=Streptomyces sp. BB1-1-1 TaxID=3074430 RepID=UPI0028778A30|nr:WYL domain-containing protein [Streptomyces sp. BB1-1-1]WND37413.1 WYL domain-containing protein [Streptomyces sp. BB1-1-1]
MSRPQRLIELLAALQARPRTTAESLAGELGVSTRTVLRDVRALVDAGIPVFTERGKYGGISLLPGDQVDLSKLTTGEADLLRAVGLDPDRARRVGGEAAARSALRKLTPRRSPPPPARDDLPLSLAEVIAIDNRPWFGEAAPLPDVAALVRDLRTGRRLRIGYRRSGAAAAEDFVVDPYGLVERAGRWYLVGDRDGRPRMFALTRLGGWKVLDTDRRLRPGADLVGTARELGEVLEGRQDVVVTARVDVGSIDLARRILGARLRTVSDRQGGDGRVEITVAYGGLDGVRQLLQFSDHIEVVDPEPARRLIHRLAARTAHTHRPATVNTSAETVHPPLI